MSLLFIEKVKENQKEFANGVINIANDLKFNPNWLMGLINSETAGTFRPDIKNAAGSGATGLIQFMPKTAIALGTTVEALAKMSNVEQLVYVKKYIVMTLKNIKKTEIQDYDDLYFMIFYPAAVGKADTWAFPDQIYAQNKGIDANKNGIITVAEFREFIKRKIPTGLFIEFMNKDTKKKPFLHLS